MDHKGKKEDRLRQGKYEASSMMGMGPAQRDKFIERLEALELEKKARRHSPPEDCEDKKLLPGLMRKADKNEDELNKILKRITQLKNWTSPNVPEVDGRVQYLFEY